MAPGKNAAGPIKNDAMRMTPSPRFMYPTAVGILICVPMNTRAAKTPHNAVRRSFDLSFVFEALYYDIAAAAGSVVFNLIQAGAAIVIAIPLTYAIRIRKTR